MPIQLSDGQIQEYLDAFDKFDADGDGYVTRDEVFNILERIGLFTTPEKMMATLKANGLNNDKIGQMEFLRLAKAFLEKRQPDTKVAMGSGNMLAATTARTIMKMSNWLQGGEDGADANAVTTTSFFSKSLPNPASTPATAMIPNFPNAKIGASPANGLNPADETVVIIDGVDNESDYEYYSYSSDSDGDDDSAELLLQPGTKSDRPPSAGGTTRKHMSLPADASVAVGGFTGIGNGAVTLRGSRSASPSTSNHVPAGDLKGSSLPPRTISAAGGNRVASGSQKQRQSASAGGRNDQQPRDRKRAPLDPNGKSAGSPRTLDRQRGRRLNHDGKPLQGGSGGAGRGVSSGGAGQSVRRKGPAALHDPKVRKQLAKMKVHPPLFTFLVTMAQIFLFLYEIYVNGGLEDFGTNPFFGPTGLTLIQTGAKYVPCMRPDKDILGDFYMPCNAKYPNDYPKAKNGSCLYYDNLAYICGMGGFTQRDKPDQIWRFITPIFVHSGFLHLLFNMLVQLRTGLPIERNMGSFRMAIIYMTSGIMGNVLASVLAPKSVSAGASGSIYGLFSLLYIDLFSNWPLLTTPKMDLLKLTINVMIALAIGLLPLVDNYAHIGGFIGGLLAGLIFMPKIAFSSKDRQRKRILAIAAVPLLLTALVVGFYVFWEAKKNVCSWCIYLDCLPPSAAWCQSD